MLKAILIDDEKSSLESLQFDLADYCPEVTVLAACKSAAHGLQAIGEHSPDVVFLDIEMPRMNGFELLQSLPQIDFNVIFVTAYDQFAVRAFEFNAVDYLLKPIRKAQLVQAVQKVLRKIEHTFPQDELDALINNVQLHNKTGIENIALPTNEGFEFVHVDTIAHLQAESNYTWVFLESGKKYLVSKTLKDMAAMIPFPQFFRAHKSYVVNLNRVSRYIRGHGGYLVLHDGTQIPVSRSQKESLMRLLHA